MENWKCWNLPSTFLPRSSEGTYHYLLFIFAFVSCQCTTPLQKHELGVFVLTRTSLEVVITVNQLSQLYKRVKDV